MLPNGSRQLEFHLPVFDGPLDLLLHLIRQQKVEIADIPIAMITEQYLGIIAEWESYDLAVAGEYLVMAATLIEIKSRMLLPKPPRVDDEEAPDPRSELVERLLAYERYQGLQDTLREWEELRRSLFFRNAAENPDDYALPIQVSDLTGEALLAAFRRVLLQAGVDETPVTTITPKKRVSLRVRMAEVIRRVAAHPGGLDFERLFELPCPVGDIVLTFLAVLELVKLGRIDFEQRSADLLVVSAPVALVA